MDPQKFPNLLTRRDFFRQAACAGVGTLALGAALRDFRLINSALAQSSPDAYSDYKALVCVFMSGGNDCNNLIIPRGSGYANYAAIRQNLAVPENVLHPMVPENGDGNDYGFHPACGGLPVGSSGRALALLSGGYDSPVAAFRLMRRGLACDFVHFTGAPLTGPASAYKAYALARRLARFQGETRLWLVPLGQAQRELALAGAGALQIVAQRRLMLRVADRIARGHGAHALVTGDSLGQVSSQTLSNLGTVERAAELPVLRPLLAWGKEEIMAEAGRLGTAEISRLPDEDCCSLLLPRSVATRTTPAQLDGFERRLDLDDTVEALLAKAQCLPVCAGAGEDADVSSRRAAS